MTTLRKLIEQINGDLTREIGTQVVKGKGARCVLLDLATDSSCKTQQFPEAFYGKVSAVLNKFGLSGWDEHKNHGMVLIKLSAEQLLAANKATSRQTQQVDTSHIGLLNAVTERAWPKSAGMPPEWVEEESDFVLRYDAFANFPYRQFNDSICPEDITGGEVDSGEGYLSISKENFDKYWRKGRFMNEFWRNESALKPLADLLEREDAAKVKPSMTPLEKLEWITGVAWEVDGQGYKMREPEYWVKFMEERYFPEISHIEPQTVGDEGAERLWLPSDYVAKWSSGEFAGAPERLKELNRMIAEAKAATPSIPARQNSF